MTLTSNTASVGVEGIVNFLLCDRAPGGGHEWQTTLRFGASVQSLPEMPVQLFLLRQGQRVHGRFYFSERAHEAKDSTVPSATARVQGTGQGLGKGRPPGTYSSNGKQDDKPLALLALLAGYRRGWRAS